jgi:uncharacterized protein with PhoU and TrkA domain
MKIYEAAELVLRDAGQPMHVREIHKEIAKRGLFTFGAKDPAAIVAQTLRKKSDQSSNTSEVVFIRKGNNIYGLAKWSQ